MNRRQFLQRLGIIAAGAILLPTDQQLKRFWQLDQTMVRRQITLDVLDYLDMAHKTILERSSGQWSVVMNPDLYQELKHLYPVDAAPPVEFADWELLLTTGYD